MKKRMLAWVLCLLMALTVVPTGVLAAQQQKPNYGSSYGHIDVKTDAVYTVKVDGVSRICRVTVKPPKSSSG